MDLELFFRTIHDSSEDALLALIEKSNNFSAAELIEIIEFLENKSKLLDTSNLFQKLSSIELFDCCGTGGDKADTFNISTSAAIIAAASGIKIAKNGGRSTTSKTGSVDVLEALGLNLNINNEKKIQALEQFNLGFFSSKISADLLAPLKQLSRQHGITSFLSLIGPFLSPVPLKAQVIGVGKTEWFETMVELARHYVKKGKREKIFLIQSQVIDSKQILDELSSSSESLIVEIKKSKIEKYFFNPKMIDMEPDDFKYLIGANNAKSNAELIMTILQGKALAAKIKTAALNAALILCLKHNDFDFDLLKIESSKCINLIKKGLVLKNFLEFSKIYA